VSRMTTINALLAIQLTLSRYGKNASVVVFPATPDDVSLTVQATLKTPLGRDYAFVSGAHSQTNASSSVRSLFSYS